MKPHQLLMALLLACVAVPAFAQTGARKGEDDGPVGIFPSQAEYNQFMGGAKQAAYGPNGSPELQAMIPMLNDIALNRPMGWSNQKYGGQGGTLDLLSNSKVRQELEMMDEQYEDLQMMNQEVQKRAAEQIRTLDFSDRENLVSQIRKVRDQAESDLNSVLLPHQMQRLRQLRSQSRLRNRSFVEVITSEPLKTDLEISDAQSEELREAEKKIEQDLEEEIALLRDKARQKLISKLKRPQKKKVEEIFGQSFDFGQREKEKSPRKTRN